MAAPTRLARGTAAFKSWLSTIDTFLLDCDGVLWRGGIGVPGVGETVAALEAMGKRVFFVTNNSTKTRDEYVKVLGGVAGIAARKESVLSSAYAAAVYCKNSGINKKAYVIGGKGLIQELTDVAGVECLGYDDFAKEFHFGVSKPSDLDPEVQAVVIGFDSRFSYYKLERAAAYLRYQQPHRCAFVATNRDASYPDAHGLCPGGGSLVMALETGSGRAPDVVAGKPSQNLAELVRLATGLEPSRTCMVGDRLDTDILWGHTAGFAASLLVLTGVTHEADVDKYPLGDPHRPTHIVDSFGELGPWIREAATELQAGAAGGSAS